MKESIYKRLTSLALAFSMILMMMPTAFADPGAGFTVTVTAAQTTLKVGAFTTLSTVVTNTADGQPVAGAKVRYESTEPQKLEIQENQDTGEVKAIAKAAGQDIVVKAIYTDESQPPDKKEFEGTCKITVQEPVLVQNIVVTANGDLIREVGAQALKLNAKVNPDTADNRALKWVSDDTEVVTVSAVDETTALVTAVGPGSTSVWAETTDGTKKSNPLTVEVSGIRMKNTMSLLVGKSDTLTTGSFGLAKGKNIVWRSNNISVAGVKEGKISAYNSGRAEITATAGSYSATCTVTVEEDVASAVTGNMRVGEAFAFSDIISDLNSKAYEQIDAKLDFVSGLSVPTEQGILYYGYSSPDVPGNGVGGLDRYYVNATPSQKKLSDVVFVPASDFGGTAVISYSGQGDGKTFIGTIRVSVENSGDVAYNTAENRLVPMGVEDFVNVCNIKTGRVLRHVTFQLPSENQGVLYYNYSTTGQYSQRVTTNTEYYVSGGSMLLENVSFLPAKDFTGVVTIPYYGTDSSGASYSGKITITVYKGGRPGADDIEYRVSGGSTVRFDEEDFQRICRAATGTSLNYIYLTQPKSSQGRLYYKYSSSGNNGGLISENTRYFRNSSPWISSIDFVPASDYNGTVKIPYTGYGATGERFEGSVTVRVNGKAGTVRYSTTAGRPVDFNGLDFNESCLANTGASLDYIRFELPASRKGTLYYNYSSSSRPGSEVSETTRYTTSSLSNITFVPERKFEGTVTIPFNGYDAKGGKYSGAVEVQVHAGTWDETISYATKGGSAVRFNAEDFNRVCRSFTGDNLDYVRFTLPSGKYGTLYYRYDAGRGTGPSVGSYTNYYRSGNSQLLDDVSFVANKDYVGTINIEYSGRSTGGKSFDGSISIEISERTTGKISMTGSSVPIQFSAYNFQNACADGLPYSLSYIEFKTVPSSVYGKLLLNDKQANQEKTVTTNTRYYAASSPAIDNISFVAKAGFQGTIPVTYTAVDTKGNRLEGSIQIQIADRYLTKHFTDLGNYGWAAPSIEFLYNRGVVKGYSDTQYGPGRNTTRASFVLMICRLFNFETRGGSGFRDVSADSIYASAIMTAKELGIINGSSDGYFYPDKSISRQDTIVILERAMRAAGWSVSSVPTSVLDTYPDGKQVSGYARDSMASMIRMGMISGDRAGKLNPGKQITRAEVAVILHRMLTQ